MQEDAAWAGRGGVQRAAVLMSRMAPATVPRASVSHVQRPTQKRAAL